LEFRETKLDTSTTTALLLIDVQRGETMPGEYGIPHMSGGAERHDRIRAVLSACRKAGIPGVFIQEVHKRSLTSGASSTAVRAFTASKAIRRPSSRRASSQKLMSI